MGSQGRREREPESALHDKDADDDKVRSKCSLPVAAAAFSAAKCIEPSPELRQCGRQAAQHVPHAACAAGK